MPGESYAATVARHTAAMEQIFLHVVKAVGGDVAVDLTRAYSIHMQEVERMTRLRIEKSAYESYRTAGRQAAGNRLAHTGHRVEA